MVVGAIAETEADPCRNAAVIGGDQDRVKARCRFDTVFVENVSEIDAELMWPEVYADGELVKRLTTERTGIDRVIEPLHAEWERRADEA